MMDSLTTRIARGSLVTSADGMTADHTFLGWAVNGILSEVLNRVY